MVLLAQKMSSACLVHGQAEALEAIRSARSVWRLLGHMAAVQDLPDGTPAADVSPGVQGLERRVLYIFPQARINPGTVLA